MSLARTTGQALPSPSYFNSEKEVLVMRKLVTRFAKNEEGAALVEYGLLVGLIAVVCIAAVQLLGGQINGVFTSITNTLTAAGFAPPAPAA
jgi:pilus assembly protein Flp/PilA